MGRGSLGRKIAFLAEGLLEILFPPGCVLCGKAVEPGEIWCGCGPGLRRDADLCPRCAKAGDACFCSQVNWLIAASAVPYPYGDTVKIALLHLKERRDRRTASYLAAEMAVLCRERFASTPPDCVVPVPMSNRMLRRRGHNQAELLAEEVARLLSLPLERHALLRLDGSLPQHELTREERLENALSSYLPGENAPFVEGKTVLLADDILTTGATANSCAARLLESGARRVLFTAASTS